MELKHLNVRTDKVAKEEILILDEPNQETFDAIEEGRCIATDSNIKGYRSISDLKSALGV